MPTLKELMGDLTRGDGRKFITNNAWFQPIFLDKYEDWYGLDNNQHGVDFCAYSIDTWEPYTEPKLKKNVKMYRPIFCKDDSYRLGEWRSFKKIAAFDAPQMVYGKDLAGWQEMEVEVDE